MGGDRGPDEVVAGALEAASDLVEPILFGPPGLDTKGLELVEASEVIAMHEKPVEAVRAKADSSLVLACRAVGHGEADAVVSAGNTGATLAAGLFHIRRLPEVDRPAIAVVIPARDGPSVLLDSGANADARPEHLLQFAQMGAIFSHEMLEVERPEVRLLSIGEEPEKGNQLTLEAHALLAESDLNFGGNVESRHLLSHAGDVVVCDGFTGNICLKTARRHDQDGARGDSRRDPLLGSREARRVADPTGGTPSPRAPRPRHLRRRLPAGAQRAGRDRARKLVAEGDRQRDPARRPRGRAQDGRPACGAPARRRVSIRRPRDPKSKSEVKWPLRARKCTSV